MHIKSLKIQGFKSYRDETIVDPFHEGLNLLVGRNGSGKSNFFAAIRFVLADAYTSLAREERQSLLHDGGSTMSAFVEIEFDNADGRFPTNKETMVLRRTIGLKKDEYQLDRKSTSKGEVMSILESAGFSRSNPYYIVPQGRITHLTNQKDVDRLQLLKEVAGTKLYEERRAESTKIIEETKAKSEKIDDLLTYIDERLQELEEEKEELKQFQVQDRQRRSLEYAIYQRELKEVAESLDKLEEDRRREVDSANTQRDQYSTREKEMAELDAQVASHRQRLEILSIDHRQASADRREATKTRASAELNIKDAEEESKRGVDRLTKLEGDLEAVEAAIVEKEAELMEATPAWEDLAAEEATAKDRLTECETLLRTLVAKQGRTSQFKTQKERDAHLRSEIAKRTSIKEAREKREEDVRRDLEAAKREVEAITERSSELRKEIDGRKEAVAELKEEIARLKTEEAEKVEKRKELWKSESKGESVARHAHEELKKAESEMFSTMDRDTSRGLKAAKEIAERLGLEGYHGPLYELFTVDERYKTAVEVTAGTSLFQIVVDTDETASKILDVMLKEKSGRITFMPLNRLKPKTVEYPNAKDAIAMIKKIDFEKKYIRAFEQVFGKTIICQSLEIAGAYTRSHNLNSITLEGDKYDRKGSLSGGYHDERRSRIDAIKNLKNWSARSEDATKRVQEVHRATLQLDQEITALKGQIQVAEGKFKRLQDDREPIIQEAMEAQHDSDRARTRVAKLEASLSDQQSEIKSLKVEIAAEEAELKTKLNQTLSDQETQQMSDLTDEVDKIRSALVELSQSVSQLASRKNILEIDLNENLKRRRDELRAKVDSFDIAGAEETMTNIDIPARKKELKALDRAIEELSNKLDEIDTETETVNSQVTTLLKEREKKEGQQADDARHLVRQQKSVERYLTKKQLLVARKDECNKSIRDLGVLPEEAFVETNHSSEKLLKKLRAVNDKLKDFAHVNKKAYEQYTSFTQQKDDLNKRQEELETSSVSIKELIDALDARKDEAIERTFKQVAKNFEEVFEKLVPAGRGRLIMQRREMPKDDDMDVDGEESEEDEGGVESYTGVAIRVSFNSKSNEGLKIQQLSGGQKALVALAMIFSIQKCDPAPFYLFDEIDANLDADRRTGVAAMISELSKTGQYICTTFRPELIPYANEYFGVVFNNSKISNVKRISADECQTFVDAAEQIKG